MSRFAGVPTATLELAALFLVTSGRLEDLPTAFAGTSRLGADWFGVPRSCKFSLDLVAAWGAWPSEKASLEADEIGLVLGARCGEIVGTGVMSDCANGGVVGAAASGVVTIDAVGASLDGPLEGWIGSTTVASAAAE